MAACLYEEIRADLRWVADKLEDAGFTYRAYNNGIQYNAEDTSGIIHSYYPTTGTVLLHEGNDWSKRKIKKFKKVPLEEFMNLLNNPEEIKNYFKKEKKL